MEKLKEKLTVTANKLFYGELTMKKTDLWLIGAVCLLTGIVYGLMKAPWTHGVMIGSNNGNQENVGNNNNNPNVLTEKETTEECCQE